MSIAANQQRTFLRLVTQLRPHWRRDPALPARIQALLAAHREFGSRDRRLYRELIYTALRFLPWIEPLLDSQPEEAVRRIALLAADLPATRNFRAAFGVGEPLVANRAECLPSWFQAHCPEIFLGSELEAQLRRAPLWLRFQTDAAGQRQVLVEFQARDWAVQPSPILPGAIELVNEVDVTATDAWRNGLIEIQDLGSQLILAAVGIEAGGTWLDACAGAGGKTLQLARLLGPSGRVDAHDVRPAALDELRARAARAGVACVRSDDEDPAVRNASNRQPPLLTPPVARPLSADRPPSTHRRNGFAQVNASTVLPTRDYDGVLVDAPCSGSGTWRRAPHLKWVTTEAQIVQAAEKQCSLLHHFSARVRRGGRLVYATCSLSRCENEEVVASFLASHPEFERAPFANTFGARELAGGLTIFPGVHNTDGFFVASLSRR